MLRYICDELYLLNPPIILNAIYYAMGARASCAYPSSVIGAQVRLANKVNLSKTAFPRILQLFSDQQLVDSFALAVGMHQKQVKIENGSVRVLKRRAGCCCGAIEFFVRWDSTDRKSTRL